MLPMLPTVQWSPQSPDLRLKTCLNFTAVLRGIKTTQGRISINIHHGTTGHWPLVSTGHWSPVEQLRGSRGHTWVMCDINLPPGSPDQSQLYIRLSQLTINLALVHFSTPTNIQYWWPRYSDMWLAETADKNVWIFEHCLGCLCCYLPESN